MELCFRVFLLAEARGSRAGRQTCGLRPRRLGLQREMVWVGAVKLQQASSELYADLMSSRTGEVSTEARLGWVCFTLNVFPSCFQK